jgi:pyridoxal phosphate enzyme (YggS family)
MPTPRRIAENLAKVRERIAAACARSGRRPGDVALVAVTKHAEVPDIAALVGLGQTLLAENRVQALAERVPAVADAVGPASAASVRWHMIGTLQRNKVKAVLPLVELIHSVDSLPLAQEISKRAADLGRPARLLVQVNVSGEASKEGVPPEEAAALAEQAAALPGVVVAGLMTMAPLEEDPERTRPVFRRLRELFGRIRERLGTHAAGFRELSMGMSNDYPIAVEEGATLVRVGTALFAEEA